MAIFAPPLRRTLQELRDDPEERVWRKDIRSTGWDGGTDLSSVDTAATKGYFVDFSADAAQFETLFYKGEEVGVWKTWTPTLANLTLGNGAVIARYVQINGYVTARFKFTLGSTSAVGTSPTVSTPVTASSTAADSNGPPIGVAYAKEVGANTYPSVVHLATTTTIAILAQNATATNVVAQGISATLPFTWGTTDVLSFTATFEAA